MLFGFVISSHLYAKSEINTGFFSNAAIEKYDAVAYFTFKKPVKGNNKLLILSYFRSIKKPQPIEKGNKNECLF